jgi:hypothetical protein
MFITGSGDAVRIQPHNDVPRDMMIFSNTVLASGVGIQVRQAEGTAYRQRVIANVVSAGNPVLGGEAEHNLAMSYRQDLLDTAVTEITPRLLAGSRASDGLPEPLLRELASYPDWRGTSRPGASVAPALVRTLGVSQP